MTTVVWFMLGYGDESLVRMYDVISVCEKHLNVRLSSFSIEDSTLDTKPGSKQTLVR